MTLEKVAEVKDLASSQQGEGISEQRDPESLESHKIRKHKLIRGKEFTMDEFDTTIITKFNTINTKVINIIIFVFKI